MTTGPAASPDESSGPLAEFAALRTEIERRATTQWHVLALQIGIAGAVFGFALSGQRREVLLLVIPIATYMTFGRYITQVAFIHLIGQYIRTDLSHRVPGGLRWEEWRLTHFPAPEVGVFAKAHFSGVVFPGVSTLGLGGFVVAAVQNNLAAGHPWYTVVVVAAVAVVGVLLTAVIVVTLWRLRHYAEAPLGVGRRDVGPPP